MKKLLIKHESILAFFQEKTIENNNKNTVVFDSHGSHHIENNNAYYFMRDEILIKQNCGVSIGQILVFEIKDQARYSQRFLKNTYIYEAQKFDDVSIKLVLKEFKVELESK